MHALIDNAGTGWDAAWTLTHAASHVAAMFAETLPFIDAIPLLLVSADLRAAEEHLEQAHRDLPLRPTTADVGPADVCRDAAPAHPAVQQLVRAALEPVRHLRSSDPTGVAAVNLARADALICSARRQLLASQP
ncbi:hypothetical protein [Cellulomonas cellasea]|uniref:Uncharacterized protein n=1 Tax=Cellulomonas cellasea DSM 20118 TaxID=1408250 RepID=A0A0A0B973_9CELL|nr:hypothetical protein [Cellulomonas cellasea]KGM03405.1 hypothetical protein Q760_04005 [Cellulomonas cellasea DSM 20118]